MSSPDRQELLRNAVVFLQDPKVVHPSSASQQPAYSPQTQASPLAQRIHFLEAKGLTPLEIDLAMKQSSNGGPPPSHQPAFAANYSPTIYPPRAHRWDWRDYFASRFHHPLHKKLISTYTR